MESGAADISDLCRLCLSRDNLTLLSDCPDSSFTVQDIEHYAGIQVAEEENAICSICDSCCLILEKSVAFRHLCLSNDIIFKQIRAVKNESLKDCLEANEGSPGSDEIAIVEIKQEVCDTKSAYTSCSDKRKQCTEDESESQSAGEHENEPKASAKPKKKWKRKRQLCVTCGQLVLNLTGHTRNHLKDKIYDCPHCPMKMRDATNMKRHIQSVHEKKIIISCHLCGKGFTHKNMYSSHMMSQHGIGKTYQCEVCSKTFKHASGYRTHKNKSHNIMREFPCTICSKFFKEKKQLKIHQRVHSTDQPFACEHCPKRFKSQFARKTHQVTHSGIRFSCTLCEKSYSYKSLLAMHRRKEHPDSEQTAT